MRTWQADCGLGAPLAVEQLQDAALAVALLAALESSAKAKSPPSPRRGPVVRRSSAGQRYPVKSVANKNCS